MTTFEVSSESRTAGPDQVWAVLAEVSDWASWSASYVWIKRLDEGPLKVGSRARVKQPRLAVSTWQVTELDEGREFTWVSRAAGVRTVARHRLSAEGNGTRIVLGVEQTGPLAGLISLLFGTRVRRYVQLEADGLKAAAEATAQSTA